MLESYRLCLQMDDQGLVNTDPRNIAVPNTWVNLIPTDVRGLTFSRTPQMVREPLVCHICICFEACAACCLGLLSCQWQLPLTMLADSVSMSYGTYPAHAHAVLCICQLYMLMLSVVCRTSTS